MGQTHSDKVSAQTLRTNLLRQFNDDNIPDIFISAHPGIYDGDAEKIISTCHSNHRDISTLVVHLSEPAHGLQVTDRFISSFVKDEKYRHQRAGVCRRCWVSFNNFQELEEHVATDCSEASKGKKEKWRVLYDAFTPLVDNRGYVPMEEYKLELVENEKLRKAFQLEMCRRGVLD